jgi:hypothetical protein
MWNVAIDGTIKARVGGVGANPALILSLEIVSILTL